MNILTFVKKTIIFFIIPFVAFIIFTITLIYLNNKLFNDYKVDDNTNMVLVGDSHVEVSANDKIIKNSINLSQSSEAYIYSFYKIQGLIQSNSSINRIFLGFSYHNLSSSYDDYVFGQRSKDISPKYFSILPFSTQIDLLKYNSKNLTLFLKHTLTSGIRNLITRNSKFTFLGQYSNEFLVSKAAARSIDKRILFQYYKNGNVNEFSDLNIHYLKEIVNLCKRRNVELILLNTPLNNYYEKKIPTIYLKKFESLILSNNLNVIDFKNLSFSDDCFIPDGDHVSVKGALIISKYLNNLYKN